MAAYLSIEDLHMTFRRGNATSIVFTISARGCFCPKHVDLA